MQKTNFIPWWRTVLSHSLEKPGKYELPQFIKPGLAAVVNEYQDLFITLPGTTLVASHQINTTGSPVRVPENSFLSGARLELVDPQRTDVTVADRTFFGLSRAWHVPAAS